jgi:hypothetical protein
MLPILQKSRNDPTVRLPFEKLLLVAEVKYDISFAKYALVEHGTLLLPPSDGASAGMLMFVAA